MKKFAFIMAIVFLSQPAFAQVPRMESIKLLQSQKTTVRRPQTQAPKNFVKQNNGRNLQSVKIKSNDNYPKGNKNYYKPIATSSKGHYTKKYYIKTVSKDEFINQSVGNIAIQAKPCQPETFTDIPCKGRWLYEIARIEYGDHNYWPILYYINQQVGNISSPGNPHQLYEGQRFIVPSEYTMIVESQIQLYVDKNNERILLSPNTLMRKASKNKVIQDIIREWKSFK